VEAAGSRRNIRDRASFEGQRLAAEVAMAKAAAIYIILTCATLATGLYMVTADRPDERATTIASTG
jgi:hypothetical protein